MTLEGITADQLVTYFLGGSGLSVIAVYILSIIRRRVSADAKVVNEDKSYSQMIETYKVERDELRAERERLLSKINEVEVARNEATAKVGQLTAQVEYLNRQVTDLKALVEKLGTSLEIARGEMQRYAIDNAKLTEQLKYLIKDTAEEDDAKQ